ncbi:hypothetical protein [Pseudomonas aeruginosa]|uniref:hypothetical protein n=1 Tax=Pseudomonas aeruginosa TaxID=287 RepID=UPI001419D8B3|nr:hypothetical protein [Pseudomonas aeruginosa]
MDPQHQVLGAAGADGHLQGVIEVDVLHQLLTGRAGWIRSTRCSAPPAPMATCRA